jgi:hypothetical protein
LKYFPCTVLSPISSPWKAVDTVSSSHRISRTAYGRGQAPKNFFESFSDR